MQEKRHDRVVEMRLCFFLGKVGDYNVSFVETRMCRSTFMDKSLSEQYQPQSDNHQYQFISDRNDHQHQR